LTSRWLKTRRSLPNNRWISYPAAGGPTAVPGLQFWAEFVEVASGQSFQTFIQQRLLGPLEMQDSSFFTNRAKVARIPTMYNLENGHLVKDVMDVTRPGQKYSAPEFGLFSTAEDLRHLGQMMLNRGSWKSQKLLSSSLVDEMTRPVWQTSVLKYHAGLGWAIHTGKEPEMSYAVTDGGYGANGASGGILWIDPSIQLIRIYLTHYFLGDF